ncbi:MAG: CarD family transcriptional regulator [Deltaproteobacteria bacterium]|nr:CarD family transcriptional regulator [Candidatus Anaeroferrophillus wilburensis]MBN2888090.1 CarD family transcriptional regulator [Deltaproteobacteria bacterium]
MFKIGDKAVYPGHGVGEIKAIEKKDIMGSNQEFYIFLTRESGMTIMIPRANTKTVGLRKLVNADEIPRVFEILKKKKIKVVNQTWNKRYKLFHDKIKGGSIFEIAEVLRDLILISSNKDLSFGERKMMDTAKNLLVNELALATAKKEQSVEEKIENIFV